MRLDRIDFRPDPVERGERRLCLDLPETAPDAKARGAASKRFVPPVPRGQGRRKIFSVN